MSDRTIRVRLEAITQQYSQQLRRAAQETRQHGGAMADSARRNRAEWTQLGIAVGAAGGAIVLGLRSAGRQASAFESQMMKSVTQIGASREEMNQLGDAALRLGDTGQGPQTLADALFFVQSAGLRGSEALSVVESSARAASIGLGDTATIADLVTSAVNAYGSEAMSASQATDILVGTVREGKAEATELAGSMGRLLPIASNMGIGLNDVGAAMAAMTRTGTGASEAATQLRAIMVGLMRPTQQAEEAMAGFGLSSADLRDTIRQDGLWAALQQMRDAIGDNDTAMSEIFPNVRALAGVLDLTGANAEETGEIFERMTDTTGLLSDGFREWSTTTEAAQMRFSAAMESLKIVIGQDITPAMSSFFDVGTGVAEMLRDLPDPLRQAVVGIGGVGGAGMVAAGAFLLLFPRIIQTRDAMRALNVSIGRMAFNPYVLAIGAAITALGFFARQKAEARQAVDEMKQTLDEQTGAITENTREWVANALIQDDLHEAARNLGLSFDTVVDAAMGSAEAQRIVAAATREAVDETNESIAASGVYQGEAEDSREAAHNLAQAVLGLADATAEGTEERRRELEAMAEQEGRYLDLQHAIDSGLDPSMANLVLRQQEAAGAGDEHGVALDGLAGDVEETRSEVEKLSDAMDEYIKRQREASDPVLALQGALDRQRDAHEKVNDVMGDSESTSRDREKALWDMFEADRNVEIAALEAGEAVGGFDDILEEWIVQAGLTDKEADILRASFADLEEQADEAAGDYRMHVEASGDEEAIRRLREVERAAIEASWDRTLRINIETTGRLPGDARVVAHTGGFVTPSGGLQRFHGGGQVGSDGSRLGLRPDEVPIVVQTGEMVLSRDDTETYRMMMAAFSSLPRFHQGGPVGTQPSAPTSSGPANVRVFIGNREISDIVGVEVDGKMQPLRAASRAS